MNPRCHQRGLTLPELLVALVLLSVGILAVARMFPTGSRRALEGNLRGQAVQYAHEKLEQLAMSDTTSGVLDYGMHGPETINDSWQRSYRVEALPAPLASLRRVTVRVTWTASPAETVSLVTYWGP